MLALSENHRCELGEITNRRVLPWSAAAEEVIGIGLIGANTEMNIIVGRNLSTDYREISPLSN